MVTNIIRPTHVDFKHCNKFRRKFLTHLEGNTPRSSYIRNLLTNDQAKDLLSANDRCKAGYQLIRNIPMHVNYTKRKAHQDCCQIANADRVKQTRPLEKVGFWPEPRFICTAVLRFCGCCLRAKYLRLIIVFVRSFIDSRGKASKSQGPEISNNSLEEFVRA
jgi:hypothetical protein